jgi:hypothetical protein
VTSGNQEVVFRMVLDASDLQRFMAAGGAVLPGGGGGHSGGGGGGTGTLVRPDPSFMSIFKPLAAMELIKVGINELVRSSQVTSSYIDAGRRIFGAFADLIMAALSPFLNVGMLFMTTILHALIQSGLFQKLLLWSQSLAKDMSKWINDHAPQIEAFIKNVVEKTGDVFRIIGDVGGFVIDKFTDLTGWLDGHLGGFGSFASEALKILAVIAAAVVVGKGLSMTGLPFMGAAGAGWSAAGMGVGAARGLGALATMGPGGIGPLGALGTAGLGVGGGLLAGYGLEKAGAPNWAQNAARAGLIGAGIGGMFGPEGALIGGGIGVGMAGLEAAGVPIDKIPGIGKLFKPPGSGGGGGGGDTNVQNSGNIVNMNIDVSGMKDPEGAARQMIEETNRQLGYQMGRG